jgi:hydrogenase assembly chaperone HypC/HupF
MVGRVVRTDRARHLAEVDVRGARRPVNTALLDESQPVEPGAYVLINLGLAVERLNEADALEHLRLLDELESSFTSEETSAG